MTEANGKKLSTRIIWMAFTFTAFAAMPFLLGTRTLTGDEGSSGITTDPTPGILIHVNEETDADDAPEYAEKGYVCVGTLSFTDKELAKDLQYPTYYTHFDYPTGLRVWGGQPGKGQPIAPGMHTISELVAAACPDLAGNWGVDIWVEALAPGTRQRLEIWGEHIEEYPKDWSLAHFDGSIEFCGVSIDLQIAAPKVPVNLGDVQAFEALTLTLSDSLRSIPQLNDFAVVNLSYPPNLRVWIRDYSKEQPLDEASIADGGDLVPSGEGFSLGELGLDQAKSVKLYVEAVEAGADLRIQATLYPNVVTTSAADPKVGVHQLEVTAQVLLVDGKQTGEIKFACRDGVLVTAEGALDLVIDSDNTRQFDVPAPSADLERIEDLPGTAAHPGKIIQVNDGDADGDGIPDYADGFNFDGVKDTDDDLIAAKENPPHFVPLVVSIPEDAWDNPDFDPATATIKFKYPASDPAQLKKPAGGGWDLPKGSLRIWTRDAAQARAGSPPTAPLKDDDPEDPDARNDPGHFIPADTALKATVLGLSLEKPSVTLYVEAVRESADFADLRIEAAFDPTCLGLPKSRDAVRLTAIRLQFVVPDAYDEATGLPAANAGAVATDLIGVSDPRPTVALDSLSSSSVSIKTGHAEITLSGTVKDPIADNVPRGYVSAGLADINTVTIKVDDNPDRAQTVQLPMGADAPSAGFWRQHPYETSFGPTPVNIPLSEGTHIVRIETSANAAGNTGFAEVAVTLSKAPIPVDLEGQDPTTITLPRVPERKTLGLWRFDEINVAQYPAVPRGLWHFDEEEVLPQMETRGLWHFDEPLPPRGPVETRGYWGFDEPAPPLETRGLWHFDEPAPPPPAMLPVGIWHFDEATAAPPDPETPDASVNASTAYLRSGASLAWGYSGQALRLDSTDQYAEVPNGPALGNSDFTIEVSVCPDQQYYSSGTILSGADFALRLENGTPVFQMGCSGWPSLTLQGYYGSIYGWSWSQIRVQRSGDTVTLLVNSMPQTWATGAGWWSGAAGTLFVGGGLVGSIDEVAVSALHVYGPPSVTADASTHGHDGTLLVDATFDPWGQSGGALRLGGTGGGVDVQASPDFLMGAQDFRVEAWVKVEANQSGYFPGGPVVCGPGFELSIPPCYGYSPPPCLTLWGDSWVTLSGGWVNPWGFSHLVAQRSGDTVSLTVDGTVVASGTFAGSLSSSQTPVRFGSTDPMGQCFLGLIDEVSIASADPPAAQTLTADSSGHLHDAVLSGGAKLVNGALRVGGGSAVVPASSELAVGDDDFSIEVSVCPDAGSCGSLVGGPDYQLWLGWGSTPYFCGAGVSLGNAAMFGSLSPNCWSRVAAQRTGNTVWLLVNGTAIDTATVPEPQAPGAVGPVTLGSAGAGLLDNVRIGIGPSPTPLSVAVDSSGKGNDGTLWGKAELTGSVLRLLGLPGWGGGGVHVPASETLALADADFQIEASVFLQGDAGGSVLMGQGFSLSLAPATWSWCNGNYVYGSQVSGCGLVGGYVPLGQWTQLAVRRSGHTVRLFVNWAEVASGPSAGPHAVAGPVEIGGGFGNGDGGAPHFSDGLLDEVRIALAPSPSPPLAADASGNGHAGTLTGSARRVPNGSCNQALRLDGDGSAVTIPASDAFVLGARAFTIQASVCPDQVGYGTGGQVISGPGFSLDIAWDWSYNCGMAFNRAVFTFTDANGGFHQLCGGALWPSVWNQITVQRTGNTVSLCAGTPENPSGASADFDGVIPGAGGLSLGGETYAGLVDDVSIATSDFPIPHQPTTPDSSGNGHDGTFYGILSQYPAARSGTSLVMGGWEDAQARVWNDYVEVPASPGLVLGANDFAIEAWVCDFGWDMTANIVSGPGYEIRLAADRHIVCELSEGQGPAPTTTLTSNAQAPPYPYPAWVGIRLVRTGGTVTLFINGLPDTSVAFPGSLSLVPAPVRFGPAVQSQPGGYGPICVDDVSITVTYPAPPIPANSLHASILFPPDVDPALPGAFFYYFCGTRDATTDDPVFTQTTPNSLVFQGAFGGFPTTITIATSTFAGLTPAIDSFRAATSHAIGPDSSMTLDAAFTETGCTSSQFRAILSNVTLPPIPAPTEVLNIVMVGNPSPDQLNSILYYLGDRDPVEEDAILAENPGQEGSLVFHGEYLGDPVTVTFEEFAGLTDIVDNIVVSVSYILADGTTSSQSLTLTETGPVTAVFRGTCIIPGYTDSGNVPGSWEKAVTQRPRAAKFRPFAVKISGLPTEGPGHFLVAFSGASTSFGLTKASDGGTYAGGPDVAVGFWAGTPDCPGVLVGGFAVTAELGKAPAFQPLASTGAKGPKSFQVYLTFDDGPWEGTNAILTVLKETAVPATFFIIGSHITKKERVDSLRSTKELGHLIGNHSTITHTLYCYEDPQKVLADYKATDVTLARFLKDPAGTRYKQARFPGGNCWRVGDISQDALVHKKSTRDAANLLKNDGYLLFGWDDEWEYEGSPGGKSGPKEDWGAVAGRIKSKMDGVTRPKGGRAADKLVLLMHDHMFREGHDAQLRSLIQALKAMGPAQDVVFKTLADY